MAGILDNVGAAAAGAPSAPATLSASIISTTSVTLTYGAFNTNGSTVLPWQGSGTNSGDIFDATGTAVSLTYSGTPNPAGGTVSVTGSFALNNAYSFQLRVRNASGVSSYVSTSTTVDPNPAPPSAPASLTATVVNTTTVTLTYGSFTKNDGTILALQGSGTNTGDIIDTTGTAITLSYSGTPNPAGGTITVTGSFSVNNDYNFQMRVQTTAGASGYQTTGSTVQPNFSFSPFSFTPFGFTPFGFTPFGFTPFGFTPFGFTPYGFSVPWSNSLSIKTKVQTPNGLVDASDIKVGDTLIAANLNVDNKDTTWADWNSDALDVQSNLVETKVVSISTDTKPEYIYIDGEIFTPSHYVLTKKDGVIKFTQAYQIDDTYEIYSSKFERFVEVQLVEQITAELNTVTFMCEPYHNFLTENTLVFDSIVNIENKA
jgi:hypothetical protein